MIFSVFLKFRTQKHGSDRRSFSVAFEGSRVRNCSQESFCVRYPAGSSGLSEQL